MNEFQWTQGIDEAVTPNDWQVLNKQPDLTFGLTNLAYIEQMLEVGRYPLLDHTCFYQGCILIDDTGGVAAFRDQHNGTRFSTIVPDYLKQTEWRVTSRLPRELSSLSEYLDYRKYAVLPIHTCYRVLRDIANIANYQELGVYIRDINGLSQFYHDHWLWFQETFDTIRAYKMDEMLRKAVFNDVVRGHSKRIRTIRECAEATSSLWSQFQAQYC
jgi:hypothetical protein